MEVIEVDSFLWLGAQASPLVTFDAADPL